QLCGTSDVGLNHEITEILDSSDFKFYQYNKLKALERTVKEITTFSSFKIDNIIKKNVNQFLLK
ncbi:MAG: hypothetical protein Sylvanvirus43_6, partial [Sylvanvirus sp.]